MGADVARYNPQDWKGRVRAVGRRSRLDERRARQRPLPRSFYSFPLSHPSVLGCLQLTVDVGELIGTKGSNMKASFPNAPLRRFSVPTLTRQQLWFSAARAARGHLLVGS